MDHRDRAKPPTSTAHVTTGIRSRFKVTGSAAPNAKDKHHIDRELAAQRRRPGRELTSKMYVRSSTMTSNGDVRAMPAIPRPPRGDADHGTTTRVTTGGASLMHGGMIGPTELVKRGTSMMLGSATNGTMSPGVLRVLSEESRSDCGIIVEKRMMSRSMAKHGGKRGHGYCTDSWGTVGHLDNVSNEDSSPNDASDALK